MNWIKRCKVSYESEINGFIGFIQTGSIQNSGKESHT